MSFSEAQTMGVDTVNHFFNGLDLFDLGILSNYPKIKQLNFKEVFDKVISIYPVLQDDPEIDDIQYSKSDTLTNFDFTYLDTEPLAEMEVKLVDIWFRLHVHNCLTMFPKLRDDWLGTLELLNYDLNTLLSQHRVGN